MKGSENKNLVSPSFSIQDDPLNQVVSFQSNAWTSLSKEMTVVEALNDIKSGKYRDQVLRLRSIIRAGDKENYNSHKKNLPAITFCAAFNGIRRKDQIKSYNYLIVLDIDKLQDGETERVKNCLLNDSYIFSFWDSPSQEGIKGLVFVKYSFIVNEQNVDVAHRSAFNKLASYIKEAHNVHLDSSGSDTTRLCFFSFDPSLYLKSEIKEFSVNESDIIRQSNSNEKRTNLVKQISISDRDTLYNPKDRNDSKDRSTIQSIIKYLEKRKLSITYSYNQWYKVAMAISSTFTYDIGEKYFLKLSSFDKEKFDRENCSSFLMNCYESRSGTINFSTIVYYANEKGYLTKKQRERGSEVADENLSQVSSS
ncbi:MAG TPA: hypothetical protein DHV26_03115 [Cytophagales bacterium]|nr:hypothetical protein [Cytophagales bacterium]HRG07035.1 BT4734/BF3469 family protein [Cyclobacteriaceae bacterium]